MSESAAIPSLWRSHRFLLGFLALLWAALFGVRMAGPHDLMDRDQQKPAGYVMDVLKNSHWASQRDADRFVMSKPPLSTWLAVFSSHALGSVSRLSMALPSALAVLAAVGLIYALGARLFSPPAGFWAGFMYLLSNTTYKQLGLVRTDPLLVLTVTAGFTLVFLCWTRGWSWVWFWLVMAATVLTKGPIGLVLSIVPLTAVVWEWYAVNKHGEPAPPAQANWKRGQGIGVLLFVLICGGWLFLALMQDGQDFVDKVFGKELLGHAIGDQGGNDWDRPIRPFLFALSRFLPWSLVSLLAFWRTLRHPSPDPVARRFERFLFCQFLLGGIIFCLGSHKREDLIFPILPAMALFAGREAVRWLPPRRFVQSTYFGALTGLVLFVCAAHGVFEHTVRAEKEQNRRTANAMALAEHVRTQVGADFPLSYAFLTPYGPQFFLGGLQPCMTQDQGVMLLKGTTPAFVVSGYERGLAPEADLYTLYEAAAPWEDRLRILSNHPRLEWTPAMAVISYDVHLKIEGLGLEDAREGGFDLRAHERDWRITLKNLSRRERTLEVRIGQEGGIFRQTVPLGPGQSAELGPGD